WMLDLEYRPFDDMMFYAKWSRGYRQGGVASFAADKLQNYGPEVVDTYEIGEKLSWSGVIPGYFNYAAFYNDFRDQQLQLGLQCNPVSLCAQTTGIVNAASSRLSGYEVEAGIRPARGVRIEASFAYLNTKVKSIIAVAAVVAAAHLPFNDIRPLPVGSVIPLA